MIAKGNGLVFGRFSWRKESAPELVRMRGKRFGVSVIAETQDFDWIGRRHESPLSQAKGIPSPLGHFLVSAVARLAHLDSALRLYLQRFPPTPELGMFRQLVAPSRLHLVSQGQKPQQDEDRVLHLLLDPSQQWEPTWKNQSCLALSREPGARLGSLQVE